MDAPSLIKPIPDQVVNELAAYGPLQLKEFFQSADQALHFQASLTNGQALPKGLICTEDGMLTGIPAKATTGLYEIVLTVKNAAGAMNTTFKLTVKPSLSGTHSLDYIEKLKAQVWQAIEGELPMPELNIHDLPITELDIYYLLERWGCISIWDANNLDPAGEKQLLTLEGASQHYEIYDRGSCLVACPKDLFSHERTFADGMVTACVLAREAYARGWTMELAALDKFKRVIWVEVQHLIELHKKPVEILNYFPTPDDARVYMAQLRPLSYDQKPDSAL